MLRLSLARSSREVAGECSAGAGAALAGAGSAAGAGSGEVSWGGGTTEILGRVLAARAPWPPLAVGAVLRTGAGSGTSSVGSSSCQTVTSPSSATRAYTADQGIEQWKGARLKDRVDRKSV